MTNVLVIGAEDYNVGGMCVADLRVNRFEVVAPHWTQLNVSSLSDVRHFDMHPYQHMVLCNGSAHVSDLRTQPWQSIAQTLDDNLLGSMYMTKKFLQQTEDTPGLKRVVTIGSHSAEWPNRWLGPYCAAKAGLNQFVKVMQREYGQEGYLFFCLNPGPIVDTKFQKKMLQETAEHMGIDTEEVAARTASRSGIAKPLTARAVGEFAASLATGDYDWLAGNPIPFTGGQR